MAGPGDRNPVGEWTPDYKKSAHMVEIRWPYAFVAAPTKTGCTCSTCETRSDPVQVGFYDTFNYVTPYGVGPKPAAATAWTCETPMA